MKVIASFIIVFLLGFLFRAYFPLQVTPFGFDQVQIAQAADEIRSGDFTLIGPRTGPAAMFTGPLIYYTTALLSVLLSTPLAVVASALFFTALTGISIAVLSYRYLDTETALLMLGVWAASPMLIYLDRIPWNPNLMILAAAYAFIPLLKRSSLSWVEYGLIGIGVFLGYQAHFSGLLLLPLVGLSLLLRFFDTKDSFASIFLAGLVAIIGFIASIVPTILFDVRHGWQNTQGLLSLLQRSEQVSSSLSIWNSVEKVFALLDTFGRFVIGMGHSSNILIGTGLVLVVCMALGLTRHKNKLYLRISILWISFVVIAFSVYKESTPEYYYLLLMPVVFFGVSNAFITFLELQQRKVALAGLLILALLFTVTTFSKPHRFDLFTQLKTVAAVNELATDYEVQPSQKSLIVYDIEPLDALGIQYLLSKKERYFSQPVHIKFPLGDDLLVTKLVSNDVGVWINPRTKPELSYLTTHSFIVAAPADFMFYEAMQGKAVTYGDRGFALVDSQNDTIVGHMYVADTKRQSIADTLASFIPDQAIEFSGKHQEWIFIEEQAIWIYIQNNHVFITDLMDPRLLSFVEVRSI